MNKCFTPIPNSVLRELGIDINEINTQIISQRTHPLCQWASNQLLKELESKTQWQEELSKGKMMGVLIVRKRGRDEAETIGFLKAYSGQLLGRSDWEGYVPAVFDYLAEDGYFKKNEAKIDEINRRINLLEQSDVMKTLKKNLLSAEKCLAETIRIRTSEMQEARNRRAQLREKYPEDIPLLTRLQRESQHQKAELKREKQRLQQKIDAIKQELSMLDNEINNLKRSRKESSDLLQRWLFMQFEMLNIKKEKRNLIDIFNDYNGKLPPAGTGECCAPRLLQYAFNHDLEPISLAEVWVGQSPQGEIRHHGHFYEPCRSKCQPLLAWMLGSERFDSEVYKPTKELQIIYEDNDILMVNKPAGMTSVRGKSSELSLEEILIERYSDTGGIRIVHRLDKDTSGIMLIARNDSAYKTLQKQFLNHEVEKRYRAIVCGKTDEKGIISLPLRPDIADRPRQMVDYKHGKEAITRYEKIKEEVSDNNVLTHLYLYPLTGRTHQLRIHCAHPDGLNSSILGDRLYGTIADRLCLQAEKISFRHPMSNELITKEIEPDF